MKLNEVMQHYCALQKWLFLVVVILTSPLTANAENHWYSGYELDIGVAWHEVTLDVTYHDKDANLGGMTDGGSVQPKVSLLTPFNRLSDDGRGGYVIEYGIDRVEFNRQRLGLVHLAAK